METIKYTDLYMYWACVGVTGRMKLYAQNIYQGKLKFMAWVETLAVKKTEVYSKLVHQKNVIIKKTTQNTK